MGEKYRSRNRSVKTKSNLILNTVSIFFVEHYEDLSIDISSRTYEIEWTGISLPLVYLYGIVITDYEKIQGQKCHAVSRSEIDRLFEVIKLANEHTREINIGPGALGWQHRKLTKMCTWRMIYGILFDRLLYSTNMKCRERMSYKKLKALENKRAREQADKQSQEQPKAN